MAAYASTVTLHTPRVERISKNLGILAGKIDITNYNTTTAEETDITRNFKASGVSGLEKGILSLQVVSSENGYVLGFNKSTGKFKAYNGPTATPTITVTQLGALAATIGITDDDNAATTGVAVYVHVDEVTEQGAYIGHLESATAGNADTTCDLSSGGAAIKIQDDDNAATGGFAVYFDEDATSGARLLANAGSDVYIQASDGTYVKITQNADPGTPGVQLYVDDDAANAHEKILFVSPTDASGTDVLRGVTATSSAIAEAALAEVDSDVDLGTFDFVAIGFIAP